MNFPGASPHLPAPGAGGHRRPRELMLWLGTTTAGLVALLLVCFAAGMLVVWALHPTFPPEPVLREPAMGSWSWLLHGVFDFGRGVAAVAAGMALLLAVIIGAFHRLRQGRGR